MKNLVLSILFTSFLVGCTTKVSVTNKLTPGMTAEQVKALVGEPTQTQFIANKLVWNYSLHQPWKGFIPYYLVFSKENPVLESWYADQNEYFRQQELWLRALQPPPSPSQKQ